MREKNGISKAKEQSNDLKELVQMKERNVAVEAVASTGLSIIVVYHSLTTPC